MDFPKPRRLTRTAEFHRVRREGFVQRGALMVLKTLKISDSEKTAETAETMSGASFRVAFVVSRKVGGAVVRNRVRRRLREIVRHHQHELCRDTWLVVVASPRAARATYRAVEDEWLRLANRASILAA